MDLAFSTECVCYDIGKLAHSCTSILRPSTTVPFNLSLARSASALFAKVTKPNPCMPDNVKIRKHALYMISRANQQNTFSSFSFRFIIVIFLADFFCAIFHHLLVFCCNFIPIFLILINDTILNACSHHWAIV